jgi:hypothetical protein
MRLKHYRVVVISGAAIQRVRMSVTQDPTGLFRNQPTVTGPGGTGPPKFIPVPVPPSPATGPGPRRSQGLVLIVDALGTEATRSPDDWLAFLALRRKLADRARELEATNVTVLHVETAPVMPYHTYSIRPWSAGFSDTLAICFETNMPGNQALRSLGRDLIRLYLFALKQGELLRGSIAFGDFYIDREIVCGPAVNSAGKIYDSADWAGVVIARDSERHLEPRVDTDGDPFYERWQVPIQRKHSEAVIPEAFWTLAWPIAHIGLFNMESLDRGELLPRVVAVFDRSERPDVLRKRTNTLAYIRELQARQNARTDAFFEGLSP